MKFMATLMSVCLATLLFSGSVIAGEYAVPCKVNNSSNPGGTLLLLDRMYVHGDIRVFYTLTGTHGVVYKTDFNHNGIPDYVENIAAHAQVARHMLNVLGFRDPLDSGRYRAVDFIDINILALGGPNGLVYDEPWEYSQLPGRANVCSLRFDLSNSVASFTGLVVHEVFHLYQAGYSMIQRVWVDEGIADWVGSPFRPSTATQVVAKSLPSTMAEMTRVFSESPSSPFWRRLALLMDGSDGFIDLPDHLLDATNANGTPIIKSSYLRGARFVAALYQALDAEDDVVSAQQGWAQYNWTDANQKSAAHDLRLLRVIQRVVRRTGITSPEIEAFLAIQ